MLDEATSAVDLVTEAQIQDAFKRSSSGKPTLVIARRLSTIIDAGMILFLEGGKIVERSNHNELLAKGCRYAELWRVQTKCESNNCN